MKYVFTILFMMLVWNVSAQKYHKCSIYEYRDSAHQGLVCTQIYNEKGKIIHEEANYYCNYDGGSQTYIKEDGVYDYYYDDTLLKTSEYSIAVGKRQEYRRTKKTFFFYNDLKKVAKEITIDRLYGSPAYDTVRLVEDDTGIRIARVDTLDTLKNIYDYNVQGRLIRSDSFEYYKYDKDNRLIFDSISGSQPWITKYEYNNHGYIAYNWHSGGYPGYKDEYILDDKNRIISISRFYSRDNIDGNGVTYTLFNRDVTEYFPDGRIAKTKHFSENTLTVTHTFVYE